MSYLVLARKWRPKNFAELVGQEHVVRALSNGLATGRIHHAFLFTGTRGVGKTTIARIIAKALNCETGVSAEPCGKCSACLEIDAGRFVDLLEIDAASRTKVDDTRELLDNVVYAPARGRYKVYLIDEVHMLSAHSFNALLKTLEEPPPHVKFVLATTDPQKLPVTVLSRCLKFHLKRLSVSQISGQMAHILDAEKIVYEREALDELARGADGSMRDGLSLLDQAIGFGGGEVKAEITRTMLGAVARDSLLDLLLAISAGQPGPVWAQLTRIVEHNPAYQTVCGQLLELLHDAALQQTFGRDAEMLELHPKVAQLAATVDAQQLQLLYQITLLATRDLYLAPDPRVAFEMAVLRMLAFAPVEAPASPAPTSGGNGPVTPRKPPGFPVPPPASAGGTRADRSQVATPAPAAAMPRAAEPPVAARSEAVPEVFEVLPRPAPAAEAIPTPVATAMPVASGVPVVLLDRFESVVSTLGLSGPLAELARSLCLQRFDASTLALILPRELAYLLSETAKQALLTRLAAALPELQLSLEVGARCSQTLAERAAERRAQHARSALEQLSADPRVVALQREFDARLLPDTLVLPATGGLQ